MNEQQIRKYIKNFLTALKIKCPPTDLKTISKYLNIDVFLTNNLPSHISGFTMKSPSGKGYLIAINNVKSRGHRRFTLAHEIAHILLGHVNHNLLMLANYEAQQKNFWMERAANIAASEMLMPTEIMCVESKRLNYDTNKLTELFIVSKHSMSIRLKEIK